MAEQWLSIVEYARATGISDMTIRRRIRTGRIKAELKDGKYFIPVASDRTSAAAPRSSEANSGQHSNLVRNHPSPSRPAERAMPHVTRNPNSSAPFAVEANHVPAQFRENPLNAAPTEYNSVTQSIQEWSALPESLAQPLVEAGLASVEARSLIEFCDRALEQARYTVRATQDKYAARLESMTAQLANRDQEIKALNQQIEDLQLLVQILERKKIG